MALDKLAAPNIDNSNPSRYPKGQIKDNDGTGNGTPVNRQIYSDIHEFFVALMRLAAIDYNGKFENAIDGYQYVDAARALAGKNDIIQELNTADGKVTVPVKLGLLQPGEFLICKAAVDLGSETEIKGADNVVKTISAPSAYKAGDYLRLIYTSGVITLVRLADAGNLDVLTGALSYLKAATEAEEYAGAITNKASTPYTSQLAFARRVIGLDSGMFLASTARNGLLSKEDKILLNGLNNPVKNVGSIAGISPGAGVIGSFSPVSGQITSAKVIASQYTTGYSDIGFEVTMAVPMANTNYFVRSHIQSNGTIGIDEDIACPVFKPLSTTKFQWYIQDLVNGSKNLTIYLEVVQA